MTMQMIGSSTPMTAAATSVAINLETGQVHLSVGSDNGEPASYFDGPIGVETAEALVGFLSEAIGRLRHQH